MKLNVVHGVWKFYWIVRDNGKRGVPFISIGWMHELGGYWRRGRGLQIRIAKYVLQFGLCKKQEVPSEFEGYLNALDGRIMNTKVSEISTWR